jgi:hypothetical protein
MLEELGGQKGLLEDIERIRSSAMVRGLATSRQTPS